MKLLRLRLWDTDSHLMDTQRNARLAGGIVGGGVLGVLAVLQSLPWVVTALLMLVGFVIATWGVNGLIWQQGRRRPPPGAQTYLAQPPLSTTGGFSPESWLSAELSHDREKAQLGAFVFDTQVDLSHIDGTERYIDIRFGVYNGSLFKLTLGHRIEGSIIYEGEQRMALRLTPVPEIAAPSLPIERLGRMAQGRLSVRQWLSPLAAGDVLSRVGAEVSYYFQDVAIWVDTEGPDGSLGPSFRLAVPDEIRVTVPQQS